MMQVKDLTVGSFQGIITLVYEDKESNSKVLEKLKSKKVFEGKSDKFTDKHQEETFVQSSSNLTNNHERRDGNERNDDGDER